MNIKFLCLVKESENEQILKIIQEKSENLDEESLLILQKYKDKELQAHQRDKINSQKGNWFLQKDENALCKYSYPDYRLFEFFKEIQDQIKETPDFLTIETQKLKKQIKPLVSQKLKKFENLQAFDKISQANANINDVKVTIESGIKKIIDNTENMDDLQKNSEAMKTKADAFNKQAYEVNRIMYWRNMKLKIVIAVIIVAILLAVIVPLATK